MALVTAGFALIVLGLLIIAPEVGAIAAFSGLLVAATALPAFILALAWQKKFHGLRRGYGSYYLRAALDATVWSFSLGSLLWLAIQRSDAFVLPEDLTGQILSAAAATVIVSLFCAARWLNAMAEESEQPPRFNFVLSQPARIPESCAELAIVAAALILSASNPANFAVPILASLALVILAQLVGVVIFTILSLPLNEEELRVAV